MKALPTDLTSIEDIFKTVENSPHSFQEVQIHWGQIDLVVDGGTLFKQRLSRSIEVRNTERAKVTTLFYVTLSNLRREEDYYIMDIQNPDNKSGPKGTVLIR